MELTIRSTKTILGVNCVRKLPFVSSAHHVLCPMYWLQRLFCEVSLYSEANLFFPKKVRGIGYSLFHKKFNKLSKIAGVDGHFATNF